MKELGRKAVKNGGERKKQKNKKLDTQGAPYHCMVQMNLAMYKSGPQQITYTSASH